MSKKQSTPSRRPLMLINAQLLIMELEQRGYTILPPNEGEKGMRT